MITHGYEVVAWTQHWIRIDGAWHREAIAVRLADGQPRRIAVRDA